MKQFILVFLFFISVLPIFAQTTTPDECLNAKEITGVAIGDVFWFSLTASDTLNLHGCNKKGFDIWYKYKVTSLSTFIYPYNPVAGHPYSFFLYKGNCDSLVCIKSFEGDFEWTKIEGLEVDKYYYFRCISKKDAPIDLVNRFAITALDKVPISSLFGDKNDTNLSKFIGNKGLNCMVQTNRTLKSASIEIYDSTLTKLIAPISQYRREAIFLGPSSGAYPNSYEFYEFKDGATYYVLSKAPAFLGGDVLDPFILTKDSIYNCNKPDVIDINNAINLVGTTIRNPNYPNRCTSANLRNGWCKFSTGNNDTLKYISFSDISIGTKSMEFELFDCAKLKDKSDGKCLGKHNLVPNKTTYTVKASVAPNTDYLLRLAVDYNSSSHYINIGVSNTSNQVDAVINPHTLTVYPNPNDGTGINIEFSAETSKSNISIRDILGREVYKKTVEAEIGNQIHTLETNLLTAGVYFVEVLSNNKISSARFVVE